MGQGGLRGGQGSGSTSGSVELIILGFLFGFFLRKFIPDSYYKSSLALLNQSRQGQPPPGSRYE